MPPVMGAAAFIMAEFLQVPYGAVVIAAVIPAVLYYAALFIHVDLEAAKQRIGAAQVEDPPKFLEVLKSGWHFPIPLIFLIVTIAYPETFQIPIERAAVYTTAIMIVLSMTFGYRGTSRDADADAARRARHRARRARYRADRRRRRHGGRRAQRLRHFLRPDPATDRAQRRQPVRAAAADRAHQHHPRHGHADGERLRADRDAAGAVDHQARRLADGGAHVRDVFRHAVDDHAAGGDRRLRRGQYRARLRLDHRLDRGGGGLEHVLHSVLVRHRAEHADATTPGR